MDVLRSRPWRGPAALGLALLAIGGRAHGQAPPTLDSAIDAMVRSASAPGALDPAAVAAGYGGGYPAPQKASPQAEYYPSYAPAPQSSPAPMALPAPASAPAPGPAMTAVPTFAPQYSMPAQVVQIPGPNVVVQQGQPQVFVSQAAAPMAAQAAPVAAGNMFLQASAPAVPMQAQVATFAAAPAPAFSMVAAPAAVAPVAAPVAFAAPAAVAPVAAAAPAPAPAAVAPAATAFAAVNNQTLALSTAGSTTSVRLRTRPFGTAMSRLGQRLIQYGSFSVETVQENRFNPAIAQAGGGPAILQTSSVAPLATPPAPVAAFPQASPPAEQCLPPLPPTHMPPPKHIPGKASPQH